VSLASAYPNSDLSAAAMVGIAVVMLAALAFWLIAVYVAAREPRAPHQRQVNGGATIAVPEQSAENGHSQADSGQASPDLTSVA
jgi:hypothetical protein